MDIETRIINRLVEDILAAGYSIRVFDGEEVVLENARSFASILAAMRSSDEDILQLYRKDASLVGFVHLIYGNGPDVIADYSVNADTTQVIAGAEALVQEP